MINEQHPLSLLYESGCTIYKPDGHDAHLALKFVLPVVLDLLPCSKSAQSRTNSAPICHEDAWNHMEKCEKKVARIGGLWGNIGIHGAMERYEKRSIYFDTKFHIFQNSFVFITS